MLKVHVIGLNGRIVGLVHYERALQLIREKRAKRLQPGRKNMRTIVLTASLEHAERESRASESSTVTTRKERYAGRTVIVHKRWHASLEPLFRQAQIDCLVEKCR